MDTDGQVVDLAPVIVVTDNVEPVVAEATNQYHRDVRGCLLSWGNDGGGLRWEAMHCPSLVQHPQSKHVWCDRSLAIVALLSAVAVGNAWNAWCDRLYGPRLHS